MFVVREHTVSLESFSLSFSWSIKQIKRKKRGLTWVVLHLKSEKRTIPSCFINTNISKPTESNRSKTNSTRPASERRREPTTSQPVPLNPQGIKATLSGASTALEVNWAVFGNQFSPANIRGKREEKRKKILATLNAYDNSFNFVVWNVNLRDLSQQPPSSSSRNGPKTRNREREERWRKSSGARQKAETKWHIYFVCWEPVNELLEQTKKLSGWCYLFHTIQTHSTHRLSVAGSFRINSTHTTC